MSSGEGPGLGFDPSNMPAQGSADFSHLRIADIRDRFVPLSDAEIQGVVDALERAKSEAQDQREFIARVAKVLADATELGIKLLV